MKIAIHNSPGSFSDRWIEYCQQQNVPYKLVNCYDSDIIAQLSNCDALMWHHHHAEYKDVLFAKQLLFSLEQAGKKVFPDFNTCWHFDDKLGQKYLLESIGAPLVPTYVFFDEKEARSWVESTDFPKVFKLRSGAGSMNVRLVANSAEAMALCKTAFGRGFKVTSGYLSDFSTKVRKTVSKRDYLGKIRRLPASMRNIYLNNRTRSREKGYVYFQDFIPNNKTDYRIKIVSSKCWGFQRKARPNDFRASGSGELVFDINQIPLEMIKIAFDVYHKLKFQSIAFDFILSNHKKPLIVEMSYGFGMDPEECDYGYWDKNLIFHSGAFNPYGWMVEQVLSEK